MTREPTVLDELQIRRLVAGVDAAMAGRPLPTPIGTPESPNAETSSIPEPVRS